MESPLRPFCRRPEHDSEKSQRGDLETQTSIEQKKVEKSISSIFSYARSTMNESTILLNRAKHVTFLKKHLRRLNPNFKCLDASRPWMVYWIAHALEILGVELEQDEKTDLLTFLGQCQDTNGGFGGGPGQMSHLAPTYAAVCALCIIGTEEAFKVINRKGLYAFLQRMKTAEGAFTMHEGGEIDIRGVYCAISVAKLSQIDSEELFDGTPQWLVRCQTYEGGFSGAPGLEAHGGYTYCGLAALHLLGSQNQCQLDALMHWAVCRQMRYEGGFQGRTNKLVDGCYSFWQGGLFPLIHAMVESEDVCELNSDRWLFHQEALQEYLLLCCQHPKGGLIDKPGRPSDFYHTCYTLSGLSIAQHFTSGKHKNKRVLGSPANELLPVDYLFNIGTSSAEAAKQYFKTLPSVLSADR